MRRGYIKCLEWVINQVLIGHLYLWKWHQRFPCTFLPLPWNDEVVSQPENAWKIDIILLLSRPSVEQILLTLWTEKSFPTPNATLSSRSLHKSLRKWNFEIRMIRISVSRVLIQMFFMPLRIASITCTTIRVSASSWEQYLALMCLDIMILLTYQKQHRFPCLPKTTFQMLFLSKMQTVQFCYLDHVRN